MINFGQSEISRWRFEPRFLSKLKSWLAAALFWAASTVAQGAEGTRSQHVVILTSHGAEERAYRRIIDGIQERLSSRPGLVISLEHLDLHDHGHPEHAASLEDVLTTKYFAVGTDVIFTIDLPALTFAIQHRRRIFNDAPIVFTEVDMLDASEAVAIPNATGVIGGHEILANLEAMLAIHPSVERIVVVDDQSEQASALRRQVVHAEDVLSERVRFEHLPQMPIDALETRLAHLDSEYLVFVVHYRQDGAGRKIDALQAITRISRASSVPTYGIGAETVGFGVVGGYLRSSLGLGQAVADLAERLLDGEVPTALPVLPHAPHSYVFDYRQLVRFQIDEDVLPAGSIILEEPDTFYFRYRGYLWTAVAVVAALLVYIWTLLLSLSRRRRVAQGLERLVSSSTDVGTERSSDRIVAAFTRVLPTLKPVNAWRYAPFAGQFEPSRISTSNDGVQEISPLVRDAISHSATRYKGRRLAVVIPEESMPVTVAEFETGRSLDNIDQRLIEIASQALVADQMRREADKTAAALRMATAVQQAMLPDDFADLGLQVGLDVHAMLVPAQAVGGDLYDVFMSPTGKLCLLVGDVSDKGMPAALLMAVVRTAIRAAAERTDDVALILDSANRIIEADNKNAMFVTLFIGIWDPATGLLHYSNAGHNPPLISRNGGRWESLPVDANIALGLLANASYASASKQLQAGDRVFFYTDGVNEAFDVSGNQYGMERLMETLPYAQGVGEADEQPAVSSARAVIEAIETDLSDFARGAPASDDITMLCISTS